MTNKELEMMAYYKLHRMRGETQEQLEKRTSFPERDAELKILGEIIRTVRDPLLKRIVELCDESRERMEANCDSTFQLPSEEWLTNATKGFNYAEIAGATAIYHLLRSQIKTAQPIDGIELEDMASSFAETSIGNADSFYRGYRAAEARILGGTK